MTPYYEHAGITIYHGDCREVMPVVSADVMVTDPPYGMNYLSGWEARPIVNDESVVTRDEVLASWSPRPAIVFGRWSEPKPVGVHTCLTWDKGDWPGMGDLSLPWGPSTEEIYVIGRGFIGKRSGTLLRCDRKTGETVHPNEKPVELIRSLLDKCLPAWRVIDPFMGSGTTLRAAKDLGRRATGIEIEEKYCESAAKRLSQEVMFA